MTIIAKLAVTLEDMEPPVKRHLEVPFDIRLDRLHQVLQAAFGWTDSHLWQITAGDVGWGIPDPDWGDGPLDGRKATLYDVIEDTGAETLVYHYDFGDGWEHKIKVTSITDGRTGEIYPRLVDGEGRCPPEDVGGPWGYGEFLQAIADPNHEEHESWIEWGPPNFNPNDAGIEDLQHNVRRLAQRWRPRRKNKANPK